NVIPDFMPTGVRNAEGKFVSAATADDALVIADSKFVWDDAGQLQLTDQVRAMLAVSGQKNKPFVFLMKSGGGGVSKSVDTFAKAVGADYTILTSPLVR